MNGWMLVGTKHRKARINLLSLSLFIHPSIHPYFSHDSSNLNLQIISCSWFATMTTANPQMNWELTLNGTGFLVCDQCHWRWSDCWLVSSTFTDTHTHALAISTQLNGFWSVLHIPVNSFPNAPYAQCLTPNDWILYFCCAVWKTLSQLQLTHLLFLFLMRRATFRLFIYVKYF